MVVCNNCNRENDDNVIDCAHCGQPLVQYHNVTGVPIYGGSSVGQVLGMRFVISEQLYESELFCIFAAEDAAEDAKVILQVLPNVLASVVEISEQLKKQVEKFTSIKQPKLIVPDSFVSEEGICFFVYEHFEGQSLEKVLSHNRPVSLEEAISLFEPLADALDRAHLDGFVHGDIHPSNLYITKEHEAKFAYFGMANIVIDALQKVTDEKVKLQRRFIAPEQLFGGKANKYSDIYSLAACMYESLSSHPPYWQAPMERKFLKQPPAKLEMLDEAQNAVMIRALSHVPKNRYSSAAEFIQSLKSPPTELLQKEKPAPVASTDDSLSHEISEKIEQLDGKIGEIENRIREELEENQRHTDEQIERIRRETISESEDAKQARSKIDEQLNEMKESLETLLAENKTRKDAESSQRAATEESLQQTTQRIEQLHEQIEAQQQAGNMRESQLQQQNQRIDELAENQRSATEDDSLQKDKMELLISDFDRQISQLKDGFDSKLETSKQAAVDLRDKFEALSEAFENLQQNNHDRAAEDAHIQNMLESLASDIQEKIDALHQENRSQIELEKQARLQLEEQLQQLREKIEQLSVEASAQDSEIPNQYEAIEKAVKDVKFYAKRIELAIEDAQKRVEEEAAARAEAEMRLLAYESTLEDFKKETRDLIGNQQVALYEARAEARQVPPQPQPRNGYRDGNGQPKSHHYLFSIVLVILFAGGVFGWMYFYGGWHWTKSKLFVLQNKIKSADTENIAATKGVENEHEEGQRESNDTVVQSARTSENQETTSNEIVTLTKTDNKTTEASEQSDLEIDHNALFELGLMYYIGKDGNKDYWKAFDYFEKAAKAGNATAMYNVGRMYYDGLGVKKDLSKSVEWYEKASLQGVTKAMNHLAQMYYLGDGVEQDHAKSAEYYLQSAEQGDTKAMYNLALLYYRGVGVNKDVRKAMVWFIKAARKGDTDAMYQLGVLFENGAGIEKDFDKAIYWYQSAAREGHEPSQNQLKQLGKSW